MPATTPDSITPAVRAELARREWTQSRLAAEARVPQPQLSAWLAGKRGIGYPALLRVLAALGLGVSRSAAPPAPRAAGRARRSASSSPGPCDRG